MECPKCRTEYSPGDIECKKCGIIFEKYYQRQLQQTPPPPVKTGNKNSDKQEGSLTTCPACKREVSKRAITCPHCGDPISDKRDEPNQNQQKPLVGEIRNKTGIGCLGLIFLGGIFSFFISHGCHKETQPDPQIDLKAQQRREDEDFIFYSQQEVTKRLRDPESAKFSNAIISRKTGSPIVCGFVNSKNGFGGYTGAQRFISAGKTLAILETDMAAGEMDKSWREFCE